MRISTRWKSQIESTLDNYPIDYRRHEDLEVALN